MIKNELIRQAVDKLEEILDGYYNGTVLMDEDVAEEIEATIDLLKEGAGLE